MPRLRLESWATTGFSVYVLETTGRHPGFLPSLTLSDTGMLSLRHFSEDAADSEKSTECRIRRHGYKF